MEAKFQQMLRQIEKAEKVLLVAHRKPDGDTLGSCIALKHALVKLNKEVQMACIDEIPDRYSFMPDVNDFISEFVLEDYDLIIVSDAGASYMTNYHEVHPDIFNGDIPVINIDHHASNDNFGTINIVQTTSASTTMIVYNFLKFAGFDISPKVATALLTGIYNDTGSFMHQNTTPDTMKIASDLLALGGRTADVSRNLFKTTPVSTLKLWGKVLDNLKINEEGVAMSVVTKADFDECDAEIDELSGAVDFINCVPDTKFTVLLHEDEGGNVKGSFRTRNEDVDLEEIAGKFGGGGHKKAAGFALPGKLEKETNWKIIPAHDKRKHRSLKNLNNELNTDNL